MIFHIIYNGIRGGDKMSIEASAALFSFLIVVFYSTWVIGAAIHNIPVAIIGLLFYLLCFYQLGMFSVDNDYLMTLLSCIISTSLLANITISLRFGKMFLLFINILIVLPLFVRLVFILF